MSAVVDRILWRLDAYDRICSACARSDTPPLRFLAFRPDKMRLRIGESLMRSQVPVIFAADLAERLAALLPAAASAAPRGALELDRDGLRRVLGLAQIDGDLDPLDVHAWLAAPSDAGAGPDAFVAMYGALVARFFDEARAAGGGEDTAVLFQLVALSSLRNVLLHHVTQHAGPSERFLGLAALLAHLCDRALARTVETAGDGLSARLGLLMAASCAPVALMGAAAAVAARPVNAYRTTPGAFQRARDLVRAEMDRPTGLDVPVLRARLAAELVSSPDKRRDLVRALLAEGARDLALLSTLTQGSELRDLAGRSASLADALFQPLGPERLRARLERHPRGREEPLGRLALLVDSVPAVLAGDHEPLAKLGSVEGRADLAAAGALVLAFDELALEQGGHALAMVRPVPPEEAPRARAEGKAYFFGLDDEPLFELPRRRDEAFLFADMKDFTKRTVALREESMGDFLKQRFYEPILKTCSFFARSPQARVSVVNLLGDAVACRGDVRSMVALALSVRKLLEDAAKDFAAAQAALDGAGGEVLAELEHEILRAERELAAAGASAGGAGTRELAQHLEELKAGRDERRARIVGAGLEAGVFVTWGREANVIEVGSPEVGEWKVVIAEQLNAAARGTARSASLARARDERRASDERRAGRALVDPFRVHTAGDPDDTSAGTDFHNAGSAVTGEALAAYEAACAGDLSFRRMSVPRASLPPRLHKYWLTRAAEELVLCSDAHGAPALLFRWSGKTIFRGLEANGALDVWEVLLVDDGFGRDFVAALADAAHAAAPAAPAPPARAAARTG